MLTRSECRELDKHVVRVLLWLGKARDGMIRRREVGENYDAACRAYDAVHSLHIKLMYAGMDGGVGRADDGREA